MNGPIGGRIGPLAASPFSTFLHKLQESCGLGDGSAAGPGRSAVYRLSRSRGVGFAVEGVSRDTLIRLIDFPDLPLKIHTRDTIKAGRSALLVRGEFPIGGRMVGVAYKRVQRRSGWKVLSAWVFGNRTLRTWNMARRFEHLGIPTSRALMVVVPRWYQPFRPSFLATEWLDQAMNLDGLCGMARRSIRLSPAGLLALGRRAIGRVARTNACGADQPSGFESGESAAFQSPGFGARLM